MLVREEGGRTLYLTLDNARHRDVGLPKGRAHDGEDDLAAAFRETEEETGIAPEDLEVIDRFHREVVYEVDGQLVSLSSVVANLDSGMQLTALFGFQVAAVPLQTPLQSNTMPEPSSSTPTR